MTLWKVQLVTWEKGQQSGTQRNLHVLAYSPDSVVDKVRKWGRKGKLEIRFDAMNPVLENVDEVLK